MCAPFSAKAACSVFTTLGELVERSKHAAPGFMPSSSPSGPIATASTSGGSGSEEKITSHCAASAFGVSAHVAPACR